MLLDKKSVVPVSDSKLPTNYIIKNQAQREIEAKTLTKNVLSEATLRAYTHDCKEFDDFCHENSATPIPADILTIVSYIYELAKLKIVEGKLVVIDDDLTPPAKSIATIRRSIAAINHAHASQGVPSLTKTKIVKDALKGADRVLEKASKEKAPILVEQLRSIIDSMEPDKIMDARDRAILLLGFGGAFRRSELVNLKLSDIKREEKGIIVTVQQSKIDQAGEGEEVSVIHGNHCKNTTGTY